MTAHEECGTKRLLYIAARVADVEVDVIRLRRVIDRQIVGNPSMVEDLSRLLGEIDQIRATLTRARDTCEALLADEAAQ